MIMEGSQLQGEKDSEKAGTIFKGHILLYSKSNQNKTETTAINILHQKITLTAQTVDLRTFRYWKASQFFVQRPREL